MYQFGNDPLPRWAYSLTILEFVGPDPLCLCTLSLSLCNVCACNDCCLLAQESEEGGVLLMDILWSAIVLVGITVSGVILIFIFR